MLPRMDKSDLAPAKAHREALRNRAADFGREHIATRIDLHDHTTIPSDLWYALGTAGLAQLSLPSDNGGSGRDLRTLVLESEA